MLLLVCYSSRSQSAAHKHHGYSCIEPNNEAEVLSKSLGERTEQKPEISSCLFTLFIFLIPVQFASAESTNTTPQQSNWTTLWFTLLDNKVPFHIYKDLNPVSTGARQTHYQSATVYCSASNDTVTLTVYTTYTSCF